MFYLSKIVWAFLQPSSFVAVVFAAGIVLAALGKRWGLRLLVFGAALYIVIGFSPLANWLLVPLEQSARNGASDSINGAAGIIVLGGALAGASSDHRVLLNESAGRMLEAVRVAQDNPALPVIFSGGKAELLTRRQFTEADLAQRFFEEFKITPPRLKLEDRSRNTLENAVFTARLLQPQPGQSWVLVTSAYHMPRARALFEAQGFHIIPSAGDFRTTGPDDRWELFGSPADGLRRMDIATKEWIGLFVSWIRGDITWNHAYQPATAD